MKESKGIKRRSSKGKLIVSTNPNIRWNNKFVPPPGYAFNNEGYVITAVPYPMMGVSIAPWQLKSITVTELYMWNLVILMILNSELDVTYLSRALNANMYNNIGKTLANDELAGAISDALNITTVDDLQGIPSYILQFTTIWYKRSASIRSVRDVVRIRDNETIDIARDMMSISKKWKTKSVSEYTERSQYMIRSYWKVRGLTTLDRTVAAITEANDYLTREENIQHPTRDEISKVAGLSISALDTHATKVNKLLRQNEKNAED